MAYIRGSIESVNREYNFSLKDFSGGLNNRSEVLKDNEASNLINMVFTNGVIMEKRKGQTLAKDVFLNSPIRHIDEYRGFDDPKNKAKWGISKWGDNFLDMIDWFLVSSDEEIYANNRKVTDVNSKIEGIAHQNNYFIADGGELKVYGHFPVRSSTYIKVIGDVPDDNVIMTITTPPNGYIPLGDSTLVTNTLYTDPNGVLYAKFKDNWYRVNLREGQTNDDIEWDETYYAEFDLEENGKDYYVTLYNSSEKRTMPIRHLQGVLIVDYTNRKIWYEPCEIELEDEYKGANVVPVNTKYITSHKGRLFTSGDRRDDNNVFLSDVENPYYFPVSLPLQLPPNNDNVVGMIVYDDGVVVGRNDDIYVISGETNRLDLGLELFHLTKLNTHTGFANNTSANHIHNYLFFVGSDGNMYALSSIHKDYRVLATELVNHSIDLFRYPISFDYSDIKNVVTHFYDDNWYISVNNKTLVYSYRHRAWTMLEGLNASSFYTLDDVIHWGNNNGNIVKFSDNYLDFGKTYQTYWTSKFFDLDMPYTEKHFKRFNVISEEVDPAANKGVDVLVNVNYSNISNSDVLKPLIPSENKYRDITYMRPYMINRRGRDVQFTFMDEDSSNPMKIYSFGFDYELRGGRG